MRVYLSVLGAAAKTERGYNTRSKCFCVFCKYFSKNFTGQHCDEIREIKAICPSLCWSVFYFGTRISKCDSFILKCFIFIKSNSSMRKNPEKPNKHVSKNRRSLKLAFSLSNLLIKDFIIWDVIGTFLVASDWQRRWHPSNANCTKGLSVEESNPITWWPHLIP